MIDRVTVSGSARERGRQHGETAREQVAGSIALYQEWFASYAGLDWDEATGAADAYQPALERRHPELVEEMAGIAEGASRQMSEIVALNARTEIAYGASGLMQACECTSIGVPAHSSGDGHVYLGENWDWLPEALDNTIALHLRRLDGLEILTFTEAGMLAKFGVNSAGIGLCNNLLASNVNRPGEAFHTLSRAVLEATTLTGALRAVTAAQRAGSGNFLIGSAAGDVVDVEWAPSDFACLFPTPGYVAHANHFVGDLDGVRDRTKILASASPGTYLRLARTEHLLRSAQADHPLGFADLARILRDHREWPEAICRHRGEIDGEDVFGQSNMSVVFDLTARELHYTVGPPCDSEYRTERFPWAAGEAEASPIAERSASHV